MEKALIDKKTLACIVSILYVTTSVLHSYLAARTNVRISMTKASVWKESMNNVLFSHRFLERKELLMWSTVPLHCQTFFLFLCMLQRPQSTPSSRHDDITPALYLLLRGLHNLLSIYRIVHSAVYIWRIEVFHEKCSSPKNPHTYYITKHVG